MGIELTDAEFETGGGFEFADAVAAGLQALVVDRMERKSPGVVCNPLELLWVLHAYRAERGSNFRESG